MSITTITTQPVCAEIEYEGAKGNVHSDLCPPEHALDPANTEWRELLHASLDEWLDRSGGTGHFVVRDSAAVIGAETDDEDWT